MLRTTLAVALTATLMTTAALAAPPAGEAAFRELY